ncbi:zinc finger, CCHC-type containing protein [Tanacetum coccineum]
MKKERECVCLRFEFESKEGEETEEKQVRKNVNSGYVVENILIGCGGDYVGNETYKRCNKYKEITLFKGIDLCDLYATPSLGNKKYFMTFIDDASKFSYVYLLHTKDEALDKFKVFKTEVELQQGSLIKRFRTDRGGERGIECIFVGYAKHSKAFRFYVIEPNESVSINAIIESRDAIFDENRFKSIPRPIQSVEDDPKTFDEAMNSHDGFRQKSWIDYFDTYALMARISAIRLLIALASIHNLIIHQIDVKTTFLNGELNEVVYMNQPKGFIMPGNENKVDLTKEFLSSRFSLKDMGEADVILAIRIKHESNVRTPMDISEKLMPNNGQVVSQLEYSRFLRSQKNLVDHLTKGLAGDLVLKSVEGMGLNRLKHMYILTIPMMCLEPAEKEDEVFTSEWLISLKRCLAGS